MNSHDLDAKIQEDALDHHLPFGAWELAMHMLLSHG